MDDKLIATIEYHGAHLTRVCSGHIGSHGSQSRVLEAVKICEIQSTTVGTMLSFQLSFHINPQTNYGFSTGTNLLKNVNKNQLHGF